MGGLCPGYCGALGACCKAPAADAALGHEPGCPDHGTDPYWHSCVCADLTTLGDKQARLPRLAEGRAASEPGQPQPPHPAPELMARDSPFALTRPAPGPREPPRAAGTLRRAEANLCAGPRRVGRLAADRTPPLLLGPPPRRRRRGASPPRGRRRRAGRASVGQPSVREHSAAIGCVRRLVKAQRRSKASSYRSRARAGGRFEQARDEHRCLLSLCPRVPRAVLYNLCVVVHLRPPSSP